MEEEDQPVEKSYQRARWQLWHLYNELDNCSPERVTTLRTAIAWSGGRLDFRDPIPELIARQIDDPIPVRQEVGHELPVAEPAPEIRLPIVVAPVYQQMSLV